MRRFLILCAALLLGGMASVQAPPEQFAQFMMMGQTGGSDIGGFTGGVGDLLPASTAAYSLRRLYVGYTANKAVNVRRASDSTTSDIGFDSAGNFNTSAFNSFCAATTCFATKIYDQSGNGNDCSNGTAATQVQVQLSQINGKAAFTPVAANNTVCTTATTAPFAFTSGGFTVVWVQNTSTAVTTVANNLNAGLTAGWLVGGTTGGFTRVFTPLNTDTGTISIADSNPHVVAGFCNCSSSANDWVDGTLDTAATMASPASSGTGMSLFLLVGTGQGANGTYPEVMIFPTQLSTTQLGTYRSNAKPYFGTL